MKEYPDSPSGLLAERDDLKQKAAGLTTALAGVSVLCFLLATGLWFAVNSRARAHVEHLIELDRLNNSTSKTIRYLQDHIKELQNPQRIQAGDVIERFGMLMPQPTEKHIKMDLGGGWKLIEVEGQAAFWKPTLPYNPMPIDLRITEDDVTIPPLPK